MTASVGDNVTISYVRKKVAEEDTIIYKEGVWSSGVIFQTYSSNLIFFFTPPGSRGKVKLKSNQI